MIDRASRRRILALSGSALGIGTAGCTAGNRSGDDDDDGRQRLDPDDWEDVDEIRLDAYTRNWVGVDPGIIEGITNPTLLLFEGEEYEITWENQDGVRHNIQLRNRDDRVVGNHSTDYLGERGRTRTLSFEATTGMHSYVCEPHRWSMVGYLAFADD